MNAIQTPVPVSEAVTTRRPVPALTPRQADVLRLAALGLTYKAIGFELAMAPGTVKRTMHDILVRLGAETKLEAFAFVGWLRVPEQAVGLDRRYAA